jgi:hypothetical protein
MDESYSDTGICQLAAFIGRSLIGLFRAVPRAQNDGDPTTIAGVS